MLIWKNLLKYANMKKAVYILPRYVREGTNLSKVFLFDVGLSDNCWNKYCSFFKVSYLKSNIKEVSRFATLSWHPQKA